MTRVLVITPYGYQNLGVRYLSAVLREDGFEAPVLYMKGWRNNDVHPPSVRELRLFEEFIEAQAPDVIGIGFGTPYLAIVRDLTRRIRKVSSAHVVLGGVHPTISPEDCIDHTDSVCIGEGELPLRDLARAVRDGTPIHDIPNLWVHHDGQVIRNRPRPLIQELDSLPHDHLFEADCWVIEDGKLVHGDPGEDNVMYRIMASRGCPFSCGFCYNSQFRQIYEGLGTYHRKRTVENVLQEMEAVLRLRPGIRRMRFDDDSFVFPMSWIEAFVSQYPQRIGLPFDILLNPGTKTKSEQVLTKLHDAGMDHVQVGIQSGSEEEARGYSRKGSNAQTLELAQRLHDVGIAVSYDVILDNPVASRADKQAMLELLLQLPRPFNLYLYSLVVFPKSEVATKMLEAGIIAEDQIEGRATKSFSQFRLTLSYPRPDEDLFYASLISMTSKGIIPRDMIRSLSRSELLASHPRAVRNLAEVANVFKLGEVALRMARQGELSGFKLREYAAFRRRLIL